MTLNGKTRIITVELSKVDKVADKPAMEMANGEKWAVYFRYLTDKGKRGKINEILKHEEGIAMASTVLVNISRDEVERARLLSEYKYKMDIQSKLVTAERDGIQIGLQQGLQQGMQQGRQEGRLEDAKNMKAIGIPASQISIVKNRRAYHKKCVNDQNKVQLPEEKVWSWHEREQKQRKILLIKCWTPLTFAG